MSIVNIFGSCVSRDIFNYISNPDIKVGNYLGRNSILSLNMKPFNKSCFRIDRIDNLKWEERMIIIDANKQGYHYITEKADYLLIDLMDERFGILYNDNSTDMRENEGITYSQIFSRSNYKDQLTDCKRVCVDLDSDFLKQSIKLFCSTITNSNFPHQ